MSGSARRWYVACFIVLGATGLTTASLLARLPEVRDIVGTTTAGIGFILLGFAIGSVTGLTFSGRLIERIGERAVIVWGFSGMLLATAIQIVALSLGSPELLFVAFVVSGLCQMSADVAVNVSGSALERQLARTIMPTLHAGYSIGTLIGVGIGAIGTLVGFTIEVQIGVLALVTGVAAIRGAQYLVESARTHRNDDTERTRPPSLWRNGVVLALGAGSFAITLVEGASNDWLVLAIVDDYGESRTIGAVSYGVLMTAMIVTRLFGGRVSDAIGRARTLQLFAGIGVAGIILVIVSGNMVLAFLGSAMWGIGVALGIPLFISAAGEGPNPARRVAFVATLGYFAFICGPPVLGIIAQEIGLLTTFWILVGFLVVAGILAQSTSERHSASTLAPKLAE